MFSEVDIFNMAMGHLGNSNLITDVNEESKEARVCRTYFTAAKKMIFRAADWPWARMTKALELMATVPNAEWNYHYRYPIDCANFLRVLSGRQVDLPEYRSQFILENTDSGTTIYSNQPEAMAEYIKVIDNTGLYPGDFTIALSYLLASLSAMQITAGDPMKLGDACMVKYDYYLKKAAAASKNENQRQHLAYTPSIQARY